MAKKKKERNREILELYKKGVKKAKIALYMGVSRQRIQQIIGDYPQPTLDNNFDSAIIDTEDTIN